MEYVFLDFETTGLHHDTDQIIQVGMVKTNLDTKFTIAEKFFVQLEEGKKLPEYIKNLTGITEEQLSKGKTVVEAKAFIQEFIKDTIVVMHFAAFDLGFIKEIFVPKFYCTKSICNVTEPGLPSSLPDVCKRHNIAIAAHHDALADALATFHLFERYYSMMGDNGLPMFLNKMVDQIDRPLRYIPSNATVLNFNSRSH